MLATEERRQLLSFVQTSPPGTPYLRRARIILLDDDGATQEVIAAELQVPITRVRQMLRAYKREGARLFPDMVWSSAPYGPDDLTTGAARLIVADLVATLEEYQAQFVDETMVAAVHESRKTTRKLRTALRLFEPYFENQILRSYRKRARKFMRRLGRSRDTAVFLSKLDAFIVESSELGYLQDQERVLLDALATYWRTQQLEADDRLKGYLAKGKYQRLLADLKAFGRGDIGRATAGSDPKIAYIAPAMIYQKLEQVRTKGDCLEDLQPERLHALRITCKELRYTLEFFEGMLGPAAGECLDAVKRLLILLGDVNDARVHLQMLGQIDEPELEPAVALYQAVVGDQLQQLTDSFPGLWSELNSPDWRRRLALSVAVL